MHLPEASLGTGSLAKHPSDSGVNDRRDSALRMAEAMLPQRLLLLLMALLLLQLQREEEAEAGSLLCGGSSLRSGRASLRNSSDGTRPAFFLILTGFVRIRQTVWHCPSVAPAPIPCSLPLCLSVCLDTSVNLSVWQCVKQSLRTTSPTELFSIRNNISLPTDLERY